jgi:chromosome segregation protein
MYLKRLEIHGFKSFAQKTTLEFTQGIIAVVGPNGSGKSNVADAIRWVLGEQSPKIIRGKKSDDMIFAGSDKKTRLGFAEVIATFDNRDRRIPLDAAEVSIGRRIDRSGESEYLLNGNRVRLLDIIDLVLRSSIGTSRYTVIGQGTIDNMILQGPAEIKNLVDEASGVKTYYIKRDRTLRRLEQTAQNLMRAEDLIAEIEPRLKSLRRQAKKMAARTEIERELKNYQKEFFGYTYWNLQIALAEVLGRLSAVEKRRKELEHRLSSERGKLESLEAGSHNDSVKYQNIQQQLKILQDQKNKLLEDLSVVRGKMQSQKTASGDPKTLLVELHQKGRQILEATEKMHAAAWEQQKTQENLQRQNAQIKEITEKLNQLYGRSKNPAQIDWALFDLELKSLDDSFMAFCVALETAAAVQAVKTAAAGFKSGFNKFKDMAKNIVKDPEGALAAFQKELQQVLSQKEVLAEEIRKLELEWSRSKMSSDFLSKQITGLEQEKLHLDLELKKAQSGSLDDFLKELISEEDRLKKDLEKQGQEISRVEESLKAYYREEESRHKEVREAESAFRGHQDNLSKIKDEESAINIEKAKLDTQMQVLGEEVSRILGQDGTAELNKNKITNIQPQLEEKIMRLKNQLEMIGGMDELTQKEYRETEARYTNLSTQVEDLKKGMADLRGIMDELDGHIKEKFSESFHKINEKFEFYFRLLFNGGRANLSVMKEEGKAEELLIDNNSARGGFTFGGNGSEDSEPQSELRPEEKLIEKYAKPASNIIGIDIKATPPGKKLSTIQALSGGERALTSIALLCSLLACFPSPFVVLDEVDAALDEANTIRFGQILATLANQTQFITITHNRETMAQSTMLYGVTMGDDGVSKLLSIKIDQAAQYAK